MEKKAIDLSFLDPRGAWGALKNFASKGREALPTPIRSVLDTTQGWNPLYRELTGAPAYIDHTKNSVFKYDPRKNWNDLQEWANSKGWLPGVANAVVTSLPKAINIAIDRALTDRHKTDPNVSLVSDAFDVAMALPGVGAAKTGIKAVTGIGRAATRGAAGATAKQVAKGSVGRKALAAAGGAAKGVAEATRRSAGNWFTGLGHTPWTRSLAAVDNMLGNAAMAQYFLHHHGAPGLPEWKLKNFAKPWIGGPDYYDGWTGLHMFSPTGLLRAGLTRNFKPFLRNWGINQAVGAGMTGGADAARYLSGPITDPYAGYDFSLRSDGLFATDPNAYISLIKSDNTPDGSLAPGIGGQLGLTSLNNAINNNTFGLNDTVQRNFGVRTREGDGFLEVLNDGIIPAQYMLFMDPDLPEGQPKELTPIVKAMMQDPYWRAKIPEHIKTKYNLDRYITNEHVIN